MPRYTPPVRRLREQPDLDQLKRQAKELLAAVQAGEASAVAEVRFHYHGADPSTFALHDALLVLARAHGFDSWPKLKAYVDGATVQRLVDAVRADDDDNVRAMLKARPELANTDMAHSDEHRALHYAVLERKPRMVRLLMAHGADARKGIYPHRDATSALALATDRGYDEIVAIIQEEEGRRRGKESGAQAVMTSGAPARTAAPTAAASADQLCEAIACGNVDAADAMLDAHPALVHARHRDGWTPLHAASAMLCSRRPFGPALTPHAGASFTGADKFEERMAARLIALGADVNSRGPDDRTPLDLAAELRPWREPGSVDDFVAMAGLLRRSGADLTARAAVALGELDWLRARHAARALGNPSSVNVFAASSGLLGIAVKHGRADALALLLELGLDPDERARVEGVDELEYTAGAPLWHCAATGALAMAEQLLQRGADPHAAVYASGSAVHRAYSQHDEAMIALLRRYGGEPDAITVGMCGRDDLAAEMLAGTRDGRLRDNTHAGPTAAEQLLWGAADAGHAEIVRMALAQIDWQPGDPRWYRMLWRPLPGGLDCLRLMLVRSGPDVQGNFGCTLLHEVAARGAPDERIPCATLLLDAGIRLDVRDDLLKSTALGWACRWGCTELAALLLERGADPVEPGAEPWATPRAWAEKMKHDAVLALLRQAAP